MLEKKVMLTEEGLKKVEEELRYLKSVKRKEIAEKIRFDLRWKFVQNLVDSKFIWQGNINIL